MNGMTSTLPAASMARLDELIELGAHMPRGQSEAYYADHTSLLSWRAASTAWLERNLGRDDAYTREFKEAADGYYMTAATTGTEILRHVKADIENGYLRRLSQLLAGELVADVWAQAGELLDERYRLAAATVAGAALEMGLRKVAELNGVDASGLRGIGALNVALGKAGVYSAIRQRQVDAWRELRNAAAHGDDTTFTDSDVRSMLDGAQAFLADWL